jgi:hypothetical protein
MWLSAPRGRNAWACDVNETLMRQTIDAFVTLGLKDAGFEYVSMDGARSKKPVCLAAAATAHDSIYYIIYVGRLLVERLPPHGQRWPTPRTWHRQVHARESAGEIPERHDHPQPGQIPQWCEGARRLCAREGETLLMCAPIACSYIPRALISYICLALRSQLFHSDALGSNCTQGLKLGLYSSNSPKTCEGHAGSQGYEAIDAQTFADWGVDLLKYDNCMGAHEYAPEHGYPIMRDALNRTGRPIYFSACECECPGGVTHSHELPSGGCGITNTRAPGPRGG